MIHATEFSPINLRSARERAGLTRQDLIAEFRRLGGHKPPVERTIAAWESGESSPSATALAVLAQALGCQVADFFANNGGQS
jgi:transcriptional regulator with XRE-family HTH domain